MKLYPIGTIVHLKGIAHPIMIIGFYQVYEEKVYEYVGVPYPTGLVSTNSTMAFRPRLIERCWPKAMKTRMPKNWIVPWIESLVVSARCTKRRRYKWPIQPLSFRQKCCKRKVIR